MTRAECYAVHEGRPVSGTEPLNARAELTAPRLLSSGGVLEAGLERRSAPPREVDLTANYHNAVQQAQLMLDRVRGPSGFTDGEFPAVAESLFIDPEAPPSTDWMGRPDTWERVPKVYAPHRVEVAAPNQAPDNVTQGEVGTW